MQKFGHFVICLSLLKIFSWNSDWLFIMKRGTHNNRGGNPQNIFGTVMPLFRLRRRGAKTWTFCNISVITEDTYLKFGLVLHYEKGNWYQ